MDSAAAVGLTLTAIGASADMFGRVLPAPHEVRGKPATAEAVARVQEQCGRTAVVVLTLGVGVSILTKSPWPAIGVAGVVAWLWWEYSTAAKADAGSPAPAAPASHAARRWSA